jgi:hypothetical protein
MRMGCLLYSDMKGQEIGADLQARRSSAGRRSLPQTRGLPRAVERVVADATGRSLAIGASGRAAQH